MEITTRFTFNFGTCRKLAISYLHTMTTSGRLTFCLMHHDQTMHLLFSQEVHCQIIRMYLPFTLQPPYQQPKLSFSYKYTHYTYPYHWRRTCLLQRKKKISLFCTFFTIVLKLESVVLHISYHKIMVLSKQ